MSTALERLERALDAKEEENRKLQSAIERLERELDGSLNGWMRHKDLPDDDRPVPRLELVYVQRDGWKDYTVVYRLVMHHLLDHLVAIPLGTTRITGGRGDLPWPDELPFRDGAHIAHDSLHLGMPAYKLMPGQPPARIDFADYTHQKKCAQEHTRREAAP